MGLSYESRPLMRLQRLTRILYVSWKNGLLTMLVEAEPEGRMARWLGLPQP